MKKKCSRVPKGYDGTKPTTRSICDLLPKFIKDVGALYDERPDLILASWRDVIGPKLAPMAQAVSYIEGVLNVKVTNSTLYSLLSQHDKPRLLKGLKERFPNTHIKNIRFSMG